MRITMDYEELREQYISREIVDAAIKEAEAELAKTGKNPGKEKEDLSFRSGILFALDIFRKHLDSKKALKEGKDNGEI